MTLNENLVAVTERIADAVRENRCNITDLQDQLSTEVQARIDGDADLALELSDERAVRAAGDAELSGKLSTEQQARIDGDARLDTAISTEKNARISADASLGQRIDLLRDGLDAEQQERIDADTGLSDRITAEVSARVSGDTDLGNRITNETSLRESADTGLQSQITAEVQARQSEYATLDSRIDAEATARASADTLLGERITELSQQSSGEIDALAGRIDDEIQARIAGDNTLDGRVTAEATARNTADQNLQSQIDSIAASSDVVDIVGTKAALDAYDTSKLTDADIIKVLEDETQRGATTYYRWSAASSTFSLIGSQGPYTTRAEAAAMFVQKDADSVGSATTPTYVTGGKVTASTASVGSASVPVYMSNGAVTQCSSDLSVNITGQAAKAVSDGQGRNIVNTYATSADLTSRISSEESARTAADNSIRTDMGSLDDLDTTDKTSLVGAINEVKESSSGAVTTLTQRIAAEETARANADTALGNRIDSEEAARSSADIALSTRINNENTERQTVTGSLTDLMTDDQTNLVAAINEVDTNADVAYAIADAALPKTGGTITGNLTVNGSITGSLAGNATTATKLATARSLNVQDASATNTGTAASFDGSGNATIKLPATIKATLTGNADTATKLATARTINGVAFDGTANITVTDSTKADKVASATANNLAGLNGSGNLTDSGLSHSSLTAAQLQSVAQSGVSTKKLVDESITIIVRDQLRQEVEAASGGKRTVLRNQYGEPSVMNVIPMFTLNTINSAWPNSPHPAFIVNGVVKTEMFIGSFQADAANTSRLVSLPHKSPMNYVTMDQAITRGRAGGAGWHCMTNAEWAAVALLAHKAGLEVRGNTNYGRDISATWETGTLDGGDSSYGGYPGAVVNPGDTSKWCPTLTGSGPASWSHDGTPFGIMDLCGNAWEWTIGMRLVYGEIQILANNDAAMATADLSATSTAWKAIKTDGTLVTPNGSGTTAGTLKLDGEAADSGIRFNTTLQYKYTGDTCKGKLFSSIRAASGVTVPNILTILGISPVSGDTYKRPGHMYLSNQYEERCPFRGGNWDFGVLAGMFAVHLYYARSSSYGSVGARPAFIA